MAEGDIKIALETTSLAIKTATDRGFVKSVQRGSAELSGDAVLALAVTISAIDPLKSIVLSTCSASQDNIMYNTRAQITNATTVTLTRKTGGGSWPTYAEWQVIEFY